MDAALRLAGFLGVACVGFVGYIAWICASIDEYDRD